MIKQAGERDRDGQTAATVLKAISRSRIIWVEGNTRSFGRRPNYKRLHNDYNVCDMVMKSANCI